MENSYLNPYIFWGKKIYIAGLSPSGARFGSLSYTWGHILCDFVEVVPGAGRIHEGRPGAVVRPRGQQGAARAAAASPSAEGSGAGRGLRGAPRPPSHR